jgi:hypothetical protein
MAQDTYLAYNPDILDVQSITMGDFPSGGWMKAGSDNVTGRIDIGSGIGIQQSTQQGSGTLAIITFSAQSAGTTSLNFDLVDPRKTKLLAPGNIEIPFSSQP